MNEDDPIVGDTINSSPSNFEAFEAIFKARFARLVIASFRSYLEYSCTGLSTKFIHFNDQNLKEGMHLTQKIQIHIIL